MPYAPGTEYRGDIHNMNAVGSLMSWLENFLTQQKQITAAGKSADYFVKANPKALEEMGMHPDAWTNLGNEQKAGAIQGYLKGQAAREQAEELAAKQQERTAGETFRNAIARVTGQGRGMQSAGRSVAPVLRALGMADTANDLENFQPVVSPANRIDLALESGLPMRDVQILAAALKLSSDSDVERMAGEPEDKMIGGTRYVFNRKTGAFVADPYSKADASAKEPDGTIEIPDEADPVFGPKIRIPLSLAERKYPHLLKGLNGKSGAAAAAAPQAPPNAKDRKADTVYTTPKGELRWTGSGWVKP